MEVQVNQQNIWKIVRWVLFIPVFTWVWKILWRSYKAIALITLFFITFVPAGIYAVYEYDKRTNWLSLKLGLPEVSELRRHEFLAQSDVSGDDGRLIACFSSPEHRIVIQRNEDIPSLFEKGIIASEDQRFYEHHGVDYRGIVRAGISNITAGQKVSGASTLTMQIARNLLLKDASRNYLRKVKEILLALKIEREFSKRELLLLYVNTPYLGRGQYGVEAGARSYFGKSAKDLNLEEVAFIVGLINKPALPERIERKDPKAIKSKDKHTRESTMRTRHVIERMYALQFITEKEYERGQLEATKLKFLSAKSGCSVEKIGPYYVEEIRRRHKDSQPLNTGGMRLYLPIDEELQRVAEEALKEGISTYRKRYAYDDARLALVHKRFIEKIRREFAEPNEERSAKELARMTSDMNLSLEEFRKRQIADRESIRGLAFGVDGAGRVRFMIGGEDFTKSKFNVATQGFRQPGSTFKAFTFAAQDETILDTLMQSGVAREELLSELDKKCVLLDAPVFVSRGKGKPPKHIANFRSSSEPQYRGEIPCRIAVAESRNTSAIRAGERAGMGHLVELAERLGLGRSGRTYTIQPYPTTAIGASDVTPIDMSAYLTFVNGGYKVPLVWENDICVVDEHGVSRSVLFSDEGDPLDPSVKVQRPCATKGEVRNHYERVLHSVVAEHMKQLLRAPVDEATGTAHSLRVGVVFGKDPLTTPQREKTVSFSLETSGEIAAKTGTATNDNGDTSDVWFIVAIPGVRGKPETAMVMVFWMGKTTKASLGSRETGGRNLIPVAAKVMQFLQKKRGLLQPGNVFEPIVPYEEDLEFKPLILLNPPLPGEDGVIEPSDPRIDPTKIPVPVISEPVIEQQGAPITADHPD